MKNAINNKDNGGTDADSVSNSKNDVKKDETIKENSQKLSATMSTSKDKSLAKLHFLKQSFRTLSVPKKTIEKHLDRDKNEPTRFFGEKVTFKAKLIGILEVEEARGDRMCQEALYELKMAVRAAGEHKQRINIVISIDGIRLRDEKTGDCLHFHPVHKISFIAQDVADSRAFGYIYGSPGTNHRFFGIKTDKAANQVVMTMRDLFQAVFDLKKREVEIAKQNIEQHQLRYGSAMYLDTMPASSKLQATSTMSDSTSALNIKSKLPSNDETTTTLNRNVKSKTQTASVIANLMDLELELRSLKQGLSQMERLTPSDPFGPSPSLAKEDPFGDSFTPPPTSITTPPPAKLPPPPISGDRRKNSSGGGGVFNLSAHSQPELHWFDKETRNLFSNENNSAVGDDKEKNDERLATESDAKDLYDIFTELDPLGTGRSKPYTDKKDFFQELKNPPKKLINDLRGTDGSSTSDKNIASAASFPNSSQSLYASQEDTEKLYDEHARRYNSIDAQCRITSAEDLTKSEPYRESCSATATTIISNDDPFETSFANFATFDRNGGAGKTESRQSPHVLRTSPANLRATEGDLAKPSSSSSFTPTTSRDEPDVPSAVSSDNSFSQHKSQWSRDEPAASRQKIVINLRRVLSNADDTDKENDSPVTEDGATVLKKSPPDKSGNASSDSFESVPEPPPRPIASPMASQPPPPLPPKKLQLPVMLKPPPRTSTANSSSHYDYIENYESVSMLSSRHKLNGDVQIPPLPAPARKPKISSFHNNQIRKRPTKQSASSDSDYYLTPIGKSKDESAKARKAKPSSSLNITISQLTSTGFDDLAAVLRIPASELSKMTLKELTECLSKLSIAECQKLESDMSKRTAAVAAKDEATTQRPLKESFDGDAGGTFRANFEEKFPEKAASVVPQVDKYAVFRELIEQEKRETEKDRSENVTKTNEETETTDDVKTTTEETDDNDKYAALRIIEPADEETDSNANETKEDIEQQTAELKSNDEKIETASDLTSEKVTKATDDVTKAKADTAPAEPNIGKDWAKFDSEMETTTTTPPKERKRQLRSPWQNNAIEDEKYEEEDEEEAIKPIRYRKQCARRWNEDNEDGEEEEPEDEDDSHDEDYSDDSDENWQGSKRSVGSSCEESSWRENGWSDADSLYDDAETSPPTASYRECKYKQQRKGYRKRFSPPLSKKLAAEHSPWDDETMAVATTTTAANAAAQEWQSSSRKVCKDNSRDDERKLRPPSTGDRRRYEMKEADELTLLKMMLGKKRLKALEEQLFNHYQKQQQPSQKGVYHRYAKSNAKESAADKEYDTAAAARHQRKHHSSQPKSTNKRSRSGAPPSLTHRRHADDTEELFSTTKRYASLRGGVVPASRPYSHDELSVSEEEGWARRSPANYKIPSSSSGRSRNHSQTSPFEGNFATASPQPYEYADSLSETASSGHCVAKGAAGKSLSRYSSGKKTADSKRAHELHPYSAYEYVSGRNSRESSQRQSPFEDDFAPPLHLSSSSVEQKAGDTAADVEDVFYGGGESIGRNSRTGRASRSGRHEHRAKPSKYYENVEPRKRMPNACYEKLSREKYKYATLAATVKESANAASAEGRSPKKGTSGGTAEARRHDPFNDNTAAATQTMPRAHSSRSKSKLQSNYDSGSDSPLGETDGLGAGQLTTTTSSKRKDSLSTYGFAEPQQHARK